MFSIKKTAQPRVFIAFFPLITISTSKTGLKKYATHFFNHAVGATGEKEATNPVTGVNSTTNFLRDDSIGDRYFLMVK